MCHGAGRVCRLENPGNPEVSPGFPVNGLDYNAYTHIGGNPETPGAWRDCKGEWVGGFPRALLANHLERAEAFRPVYRQQLDARAARFSQGNMHITLAASRGRGVSG